MSFRMLKSHPVLLALAGVAVLLAVAACGQDEPAATPPEMPASGGSASGMAMPQVYSGTVSTSGTLDAGAGIQVEARIGDDYVSAPATVESDGSYMLVVEPPPSIAADLINEMIEFHVVGMPEVKASQTRLYTGDEEESLDLVFPATAGGSPIEGPEMPEMPEPGVPQVAEERIAFSAYVAVDGYYGLHISAADGTDLQRLNTGRLVTISPNWSPDGQRLVAVAINENGDDDAGFELYSIAADGSDPVRITSNGPAGFDLSPSWSPDGSRIVFTNIVLRHPELVIPGETKFFPRVGGRTDIYTVAPDGTDVRQVTNTDIVEFYPSWSPDGTRILFSAFESSDLDDVDNQLDVFTIAADGTDLRQVTDTPDNEYSPAWSPDGSRIAFVSRSEDNDARYEIYTVKPDGTDLQQVTDPELPGGIGSFTLEVSMLQGLPLLNWLPDGERIGFIGHPESRILEFEIYTIKPDGTGLRRVTNNGVDEYGPVWQPLD